MDLEVLESGGRLMFPLKETVALCIGRSMRERHLKIPHEQQFVVEKDGHIVGAGIVFGSKKILKIYPIILAGALKRPFDRKYRLMMQAVARMLRAKDHKHVYFHAFAGHDVSLGIPYVKEIGGYPPDDPTFLCREIKV